MGTTFRFGDLELDVSAYELRRLGRRVKIERIPMDLLILLVERRGELVSRQEIVERLWGKESFFDAESGVNTAVRKVREALGDNTARPIFIQTVSGKGYRFCGSVVSSQSPEATGSPLYGLEPSIQPPILQSPPPPHARGEDGAGKVAAEQVSAATPAGQERSGGVRRRKLMIAAIVAAGSLLLASQLVRSFVPNFQLPPGDRGVAPF